jgi:hypothetical protein
MSIRFVYTPRFVGAALNATAQTLSMVKHAATRRLNAIVTATRAQKTLTERSAIGSFATEFDYYISTTGSDSNAGTEASPWALTAINTKRATYAGKRVGLLDGTYNMLTIFGVSDWSSYNIYDGNILEVATAGSGTDNDNWTVIESVNKHGAILDAKFDTINGGVTQHENAVLGYSGTGGYVRFKNIKIINAGYRGMNFSNSTSPVEVDGMWVYGQVYNPASPPGANSCCFGTYYATNGLLFTNCRGEASGAPGDANRHAGLLTFEATNCTVRSCTFLEDDQYTNTDAIHIKMPAGTNTGITVEGCYLEGELNYEAGGANAGYVRNNIVIANAPIFVSTTNTATINNNLMIARTLAGTGGGTGAAALKSKDSTGLIHSFNNLALRFGTQAWDVGDFNYPASAADRGTINYNGVASDAVANAKCTIGYITTTYTSFAAFNTALGHDANSIEVTDFVFAPSGSLEADDYKLNPSTSPAINTGKSNGTSGGVTCDMGPWSNYPSGVTRIGSDF